MAKLTSTARVASFLVAVGVASASTTNVAILSALAPGFNADVLAKIGPNTPFLNIDVINVNTSTPSLGILDQYQALMVIGSQAFQDSATLGTNLRQYMDQGMGHGIVITALSNTISNCSTTSTYQLCGTFQSGDYWAIEPGILVLNSPATLQTTALPVDPIFAGVAAGSLGFNGGSISYRIAGTVNTTNGSTAVAKWSDNTPFAARRTFAGGVTEIALNFMPVSEDGYPGLWLKSSQGGKILGNAFNEVAGVSGAGGGDVPEPGTYLAVGAGLGVVALLMHRRQRTLQCESAQRSRRP